MISFKKSILSVWTLALFFMQMLPLLSEDQALQKKAGLRLPSFFSDNMVLQKDKASRVWGWAAPGASVEVSVAGQKKTATVSADGKWKVELDPLAGGGGPLEMTVSSGSETKSIRNIMAGEVWLCSGQSNMQIPVVEAANGEVEAARAKDPEMRFFITGFHAPNTPDEDCQGAWVECTPESAASFSAVSYFFGRDLRKELKVPVGLILSAQGATAAESWISREALKSEPVLQPIVNDLAERVIDPKGWDMHLPSGLFNGRIAPLAPMSLRGVIWYQGETNGGRAWQYRKLFPLLIRDWRKLFGDELPFYFVQVANYMKPPSEPVQETWAELREAQSLALKLPATGMAVAIDLGDEKDIHPKNKQGVGERLAALALSETYGLKRVDHGPLYDSMKVENGRIRINFDSVGGGLEAKGGKLQQFAIAGEDKKFFWADAFIEGDTVVASSALVPNPVALRYAWANNPVGCNLYNKEGFPASPFRTDEWPGITETAHLAKAGSRASRHSLDTPLDPAAGMAGNTLEIDLTKNIERSWDHVKANGYKYGPHQRKEDNGEIRIWLPYENERGLYNEIIGVKLSSTQPGSPPSLMVEGGGPAARLSLKFHFNRKVAGFRFSSGSVESSPEGAVAGFEYSVDGKKWKPFQESKDLKTEGLNTQDLYLRYYVRGQTDPSILPAGVRAKVRMGGDVMWGDASTTFAAAQWQLWITPATP